MVNHAKQSKVSWGRATVWIMQATMNGCKRKRPFQGDLRPSAPHVYQVLLLECLVGENLLQALCVSPREARYGRGASPLCVYAFLPQRGFGRFVAEPGSLRVA